MYAIRIRAHIAAGLRAFGAPASTFVRHLLGKRRERATEQTSCQKYSSRYYGQPYCLRQPQLQGVSYFVSTEYGKYPQDALPSFARLRTASAQNSHVKITPFSREVTSVQNSCSISPTPTTQRPTTQRVAGIDSHVVYSILSA